MFNSDVAFKFDDTSKNPAIPDFLRAPTRFQKEKSIELDGKEEKMVIDLLNPH